MNKARDKWTPERRAKQRRYEEIRRNPQLHEEIRNYVGPLTDETLADEIALLRIEENEATKCKCPPSVYRGGECVYPDCPAGVADEGIS